MWGGIFAFSVLVSYRVFFQEPGSDRRINTVLWFQNAGEMRALCYQAFNLARIKLEQDFNSQQVDQKQKRAIVVDVDETVLDNSPYTAKNILTERSYPNGWQKWIEMVEAQALPGAVEFLQYATSKGVSIFYITNRKNAVRAATIENLKKIGAPVKEEYVMMRETDFSKETRRQQVLKDHRIVLLIGDNLGDFDRVFDVPDQEARNNTVDKMQEEFGRKFIVLPNPIYGNWERIISNYREALRSY